MKILNTSSLAEICDLLLSRISFRLRESTQGSDGERGRVVVRNPWNSFLDLQLTIIDQEIKGCVGRDLPQWEREKGVNTLPVTFYSSRERTYCTLRIVTGSHYAN